MRFRSENESWSEGSVEYVLERTQEVIKEVFPDVEDINSKYFLFIKSRLYFPFFRDEINSIESLITIDDIIKTEFINNEGDKKEIVESRITQLSKSKVRTPYPNKKVYLNSMKYGRRLCDDGFILMFDTFKELQSIDTITIDWKINLLQDNGKTLDLNKRIIYHPYFIKDGTNNVFSIQSHDMFLASINYSDEEVGKYLKQFNETKTVIFDVENNGAHNFVDDCSKNSEEIQLIINKIAQAKVENDTIYEVHIQDLEFVADNTRLDLI